MAGLLWAIECLIQLPICSLPFFIDICDINIVFKECLEAHHLGIRFVKIDTGLLHEPSTNFSSIIFLIDPLFYQVHLFSVNDPSPFRYIRFVDFSVYPILVELFSFFGSGFGPLSSLLGTCELAHR